VFQVVELRKKDKNDINSGNKIMNKQLKSMQKQKILNVKNHKILNVKNHKIFNCKL
jgi:hypothetical protein